VWRRASFLKSRDDAGRIVDFHALRHTPGSLLAAAGVHPKTAQSIMRHSTISLTMDRYTHTLREADRDAVGSLPNFDVTADQGNRQRATGTDGQTMATQEPPQDLALCLARRGSDPDNPMQRLAAMDSPADWPQTLGNAGNGAKAADKNSKAEVGFEPTTNGFAIRPLRPLGYSAAATE